MAKNEASLAEKISAVSDVLFDSIGEGAIVVDERGYIVRVNDIALEILGYERQDLINTWYPASIVAEYEDGTLIPNFERPITEVFATGKPVTKRIYFRKKNNSKIPVYLTVSPVLLAGEPLGAIEIFRDITQELKLEQAKDDFISIASHQLRTPATIVKQYLNMIIDGHVTTAAQKDEMIRTAYRHNDDQLNIINSLLRAAQAEANNVVAKASSVNIVELLERVIASQQLSYKKEDISLELHSTTPSAICCVNELDIQMVFENLLDNARKYSPRGTCVIATISTTPTRVIVEISDQGYGIHRKDLPKLFKKFSRVEIGNNLVRGTGLGLFWVKKIMEQYKGSIRVKSQLGKGSTFRISLPKEHSS